MTSPLRPSGRIVSETGSLPPVLIIGILVSGMAIGAIAQLALGRPGRSIDWGVALGAGLVGSFVGGLLVSLLAGDGLALRPSGLVGSIVGAILVTAAWKWFGGSRAETRRGGARS